MEPVSTRASVDPVGVLIAAAGLGERAGPGGPKQFRLVAGVPLLLRSIRPFASHPAVTDIVVALAREHALRPPDWLAGLTGDRLRVVEGGAVRSGSVRAALNALDRRCTIVLVHDAARPLVSRTTIDAVIAVAREGVGAVPAVALRDTVKRADGAELRVTETVDRGNLWRAQTPQGFPRAMLEEGFRRAGANLARFTDESALVEATGAIVRLVPDDETNLKVTTAADFRLAEALLDR